MNASETPAEVWCATCDQPSVKEIETTEGTRAFCATCAFRVESSNFNARGKSLRADRCPKCNAAIDPTKVMCDHCWARRKRPGRKNLKATR